MYAKLALRNVKRSGKDYLIYMVTLTFCVGLFYSFLSISSNYYHPTIGVEYDIKMLGNTMKLAVLFITSILLFLIKYVNNFMIRRKQKEFAIQTILGMEKRTTARLFFAETMTMGIISIFLGILLGTLLSQAVTAMLLSTYGQSFKITFSLFPDTVLLTVIFFLMSFFLIGTFNIKTICKIKVIDMLQSRKKMETDFHKNKWIQFWIISGTLVALFLLTQGISMSHTLYDFRLALTVKVMIYGNILTPAAFLFIVIGYLIIKMQKRNKRKLPLIVPLIVVSLLIIYFAISVVGNTQKYYLPIPSNIINIYMICACFFLLFGICGFFYIINDAINFLKENSLKMRYKNDNLFLFGQIAAKLKTTSITMTIICITLVFSIILCVLAPVMSGWITGFLDKKSPFDIQAFSMYNNIYKEEHMSQNSYGFIEKFLGTKEIKLDEALSFQNYFINREDFSNRYKYNFPILAISLSNYNKLRNMIGLNPIQLVDGEFTTQWYVTATENDKQTFLKEHSTVTTNGITLKLADEPYYQASLGENLYNSYTNVVYIFPDKVCNNLLGANQFFFGNTTTVISYQNASELEDYFYNKVKVSEEKTGSCNEIRLHTIEANQSTSYAFVSKTMMLYAGVVLLIICFTILSIQQLADSSDFRYRFSVLNKMGIENKRVNAIILKQMGFWFGLPIFVALIAAVILISYFIQSSFAQLTAYIGMNEIAVNILTVGIIVFIFLCCYFISTWVLFKRNITD